MPKIDAQKKLENFIKSRRVVQMRDLFEVVQSTSRMTVFRREHYQFVNEKILRK